MTGLDIVKARAFMGSGGGSGGGVKVTPLTVTENGTYTAESGTAYSPVTVNVAAQGGAGDLDALIERSITEVRSNVTKVGSYAFYGCTALTTADFPAATSVGSYAFQNCTALTTADFPAATSVGSYAFQNCTALTTADFPIATSVGDHAFRDCTVLTTADFPAATSVESYAFQNCTALTTADFPAATSVKNYAFRDCFNLTIVTLSSDKMCTLSSTNAFSGTPIASGTGYIYVPSALVDTYKAATNWSTFAAQFRALEDYTVDGTTTGELDPEKIGA